MEKDTIDDKVLKCIDTAGARLEHHHKIILPLDKKNPTKGALRKVAHNLASYLSNTGYGQHEVRMPQRKTTNPHACLTQEDKTNFLLGLLFDPESKEPENYIYIFQASCFGNANILKGYVNRLKKVSPTRKLGEQQQVYA